MYAQAIREANLVEADLLAALARKEVQTLAELLERVIAGLDEADPLTLAGAGPGKTLTVRTQTNPRMLSICI